MIEISQSELLRALSRPQMERLIHIDFRLYFLGELGRSDVMKRFGTAPAGVTRDIALYKEIAPHNLYLEGSSKVYKPTPSFSPVFDHPPARALAALSQGIGEDVVHEPEPLVRCEFPTFLGMPKVQILAPLTRAINTKRAVRIKYCSVSSGQTVREVVPFALVDTGLRWHARAFDRKSGTFRDFVLTRIVEIEILENGEIESSERSEHDLQWSRIIELELIPHPSHKRPEVVRMDYGILDESLIVRVRAATAGYMLRRWNVDCSPEHKLVGPEYALWLRDPLILYGAETAILAPGYQEPFPATKTNKT